MKIAVLSGKGGTGKTFVASNIAAISGKSLYLDCDVEEPNGHLFLKGPVLEETMVNLPIPKVDHNLCDGCRKCVDFCAFNALALISGQIKVFDTICHSCGGCKIVCPQNAITEVDRSIGKIERRRYKEVDVLTGNLTPGEESGTKIIDMLISSIPEGEEIVIIDSPPGSACTVMDSVKDADYCILVAEPTTFGAHNLKMVHELVQIFDKPYGVVLNKSDGEDNPSKLYCDENSIPILLDIPWRKDISNFIADGELAVEKDTEINKMFTELLDSVKEGMRA
ncbi:MAG: ATP-binding protein [Gudongella sp.]|jgi:MinD superfamily P-loop ATPase|nr:ATP-binding protein [Gudongella sp.]